MNSFTAHLMICRTGETSRLCDPAASSSDHPDRFDHKVQDKAAVRILRPAFSSQLYSETARPLLKPDLRLA